MSPPPDEDLHQRAVRIADEIAGRWENRNQKTDPLLRAVVASLPQSYLRNWLVSEIVAGDIGSRESLWARLEEAKRQMSDLQDRLSES